MIVYKATKQSYLKDETTYPIDDNENYSDLKVAEENEEYRYE